MFSMFNAFLLVQFAQRAILLFFLLLNSLAEHSDLIAKGSSIVKVTKYIATLQGEKNMMKLMITVQDGCLLN